MLAIVATENHRKPPPDDAAADATAPTMQATVSPVSTRCIVSVSPSGSPANSWEERRDQTDQPNRDQEGSSDAPARIGSNARTGPDQQQTV